MQETLTFRKSADSSNCCRTELKARRRLLHFVKMQTAVVDEEHQLGHAVFVLTKGSHLLDQHGVHVAQLATQYPTV